MACRVVSMLIGTHDQTQNARHVPGDRIRYLRWVAYQGDPMQAGTAWVKDSSFLPSLSSVVDVLCTMPYVASYRQQVVES
ncbi:hypothetical protein VTK73DRAFT_1053 [Phialemonium thermophilum]|uniref:Uncharacterized protein n=1 Tax=Phialemonium thermophilum TaxID=223376 RepID=A0ABR3VTZ5_9PEZI